MERPTDRTILAASTFTLNLFARRKLVATLTGFILIAPVIRVACYFLMPDSRPQLGMMFHTAFDAIAAGVLLGELLRMPDTRAKLQNLVANRWVLAGAILYPVIVSPLLAYYFEGAYSMTIGKSLDFLCIGLVLVAAVSQPGTLLFRFLNWRPLTYVGVLSASMFGTISFFTKKQAGSSTRCH